MGLKLEKGTITFLITQNRVKGEDMRRKLEKGLELFFQKKFEANYHSAFSCVFCISPLLLTLKEHL